MIITGHWPIMIGTPLDDEAEDISVTVNGFGAAPNCHFSLLNVPV